jgi:hypothetical protein
MSKSAIRVAFCSVFVSGVLLGAALALTDSALAAGISGGGTSTVGSPGTSPDPMGPSVGSAGSVDSPGNTPNSTESYSVDHVDTPHVGSKQSDQLNARNGGREGRFRSYGWILNKIRKISPGDIVKVRLKQHEGNLWTYDVTVLDDGGRYVQISLNASTGAMISKKSR